jgi:hypothetical protein
MGIDMVRGTLGPWTLYEKPREEPNHLLLAYIDATAAFVGLLVVSIGLFVGGDIIIIGAVALITVMMGFFSVLRFILAAESKGADGIGDSDGGPPYT